MMQDFLNKKILLGICGGVAAYKSAYLVRELQRLGAEVRVVMTDSAQNFVSAMTFQALTGQPVRTSLFDAEAERAMGHIELARWADFLVIAPATANMIAKLDLGLADDLLSTLHLVAECPIILCPAMNRSMWGHRSTQQHCQNLASRGVIIVGPEEGSQACGEYGLGRLAEPETIINALRLYEVNQMLKDRKVIITAGPTREAIDPVRYLSNYSSGKMGYALAEAAMVAGAEVILVSGPSALTASGKIKCIRVNSALEMREAVLQEVVADSVFIGAAAVADYRVRQVAKDKIKKQKETALQLDLEQNPDILAEVAASGLPALTVGFAAETSSLETYARAKLKSKKLDLIVANQVGQGLGFETEDNEVKVFSAEEQWLLPRDHKVRLAAKLIAIIAASLQNKASRKTRDSSC